MKTKQKSGKNFLNKYTTSYFFKILMLFLASTLWGASSAIAKENIIDIMQKKMSSVVSIIAENDQVQSVSQGVLMDTASRKILRPQNVLYSTFSRSGAGIIIDPSGVIVTNTHTISNAQRIMVVFRDHPETPLPAKILGVVSQYDFAFLQVAAPFPLPSLSWADSDQIQLGEEIVSIGHSAILKEAISGGKIIGIGLQSGKNASNTQGETKLIHINLNVYRGDSGGPIFDRNGRFLGLLVAGEAKADRSSFAIPSNKIREQGKKYFKVLSSSQRQTR